MSLFKTKDWWSLPIVNNDSEECNAGHLLIGNITNENPPVNKIIVSGFSGALKVYSPQLFYNEEEEELNGYRPDHLLLEIALPAPVLQLALGKFVSGSSDTHICVLHQDHLVVYSLSIITGQAGHGSQAKLSKSYQHNFQRKAFSITTGNFGSVKGRDFIAVQSLDGCVTFYEQESLGFVCFLPGFLLPGPLAYLPKSDTLVTQASDWTLQSYKYQTLSVLVQEHSKNLSNVKQGGKRIQPEWIQGMDENVIDIKVLVEPGNVSSILLLRAHSFMCYKDSGVLKFVKKLEYNPSCFTVFHNEKAIHLCVASHTHNLLVYRETALKWASQVPFVPVAIERANFKGIKGSLVLLGEGGQLQVCYLGTDPSLFVAPPNETREINYEQTDKEMSKLNKIIRTSTKDTGSLVNLSKTENELFVTASVGNQLEPWVGPTRVSDPDGVPSVTAVIKLTSHTPLKSVRVSVHAEKPIGCSQETFFLGAVSDSCQLFVKFFLAERYVPSSLEVLVITSYIAFNGTPYVTQKKIDLPLNLVVKPSAPNKEADHKITVSTNKSAVNLLELFPEFMLDGSASTALGLQYYGGAAVTLLSSRTTNRYRMQSDSFPALWIIFATLKERLEKYWTLETKGSEENMTLTVASPMPTQELFSEIDAHFLRRRKQRELESQLVQRAMQFRAVQRRLLTKFKDKTPTPLTNFDNLLEGTYKQILHITEAINNNAKGLEEDGCQLSCVLRLLVELLCIQTGLGPKQKELLLATLSPVVYHNMDQGWEEVADNSVTFVLRSILGKGNRESGVFTQALTMPQDTNKLKKHIALLVDKILKGGFSSQSEQLKSTFEEPKKTEPSVPDKGMQPEYDASFSVNKTLDSVDETEVPLGSRLGEDRARSARIRSARLQSAKKAPPLLSEENSDLLASPNEESPEQAHENDLQPQESQYHPAERPTVEDEPIYTEIEERSPEIELPSEDVDDNGLKKLDNNGLEKPNDGVLETLKKATTIKDAVIEAPEDIFGNPIDDEW